MNTHKAVFYYFDNYFILYLCPEQNNRLIFMCLCKFA